ncbi:MJ0042-type zinc finger domain-containing protein [Candidatus Fokinia crypta]|uniref:Zinc finger/thioredoxin putative domain-containing protein n=1 Tax=Candidatus Fokinia crypta TaxID=1920990 RepID=A0ABZ0UQX7_9RICK|nr:MJ0042-type zinc finger domain-containing protein [Candidatus Fokinia cryptica]WPX97967.1 hypothetical protein Fokcrypt_00492 [Candidatus Fokinia cryptica]
MSNIRCDNCGAVFRMPEGALLTDHPRFVRCSICEHEWLAEASDLIPELIGQYDTIHSVENAGYVEGENYLRTKKVIFNIICCFLVLFLLINIFILFFISKAELIGSTFPFARAIYENLGLEFWS